MGLKKGMKPNNPKGRPKGANGKISTEFKDWIKEVLDNNRNQFLIDLRGVDAEKRLVMYEKLIQYIVPKQQSISVEAQISAEWAALEQLLDKAPQSAVEAISERILAIRERQQP